MATIAEGLMAYRICAQAEGRSPKTVLWITSSTTEFSDFMGTERQHIDGLTANDLRRFIIFLQQKPKYLKHPYTKQQPGNLSPQSVETKARGVRAFFGFLTREERKAQNAGLLCEMQNEARDFGRQGHEMENGKPGTQG